MIIKDKDDAFRLLSELGAPARLLAHVALVSEAADILIDQCADLGVDIDGELVRIGAVMHDVGKIRHPGELQGPGHEHEPAGQRMLLDRGVRPEIARFCLSHARWRTMECSLEELLVALSDALWKGERSGDLELRVIDLIARKTRKERWDIFTDLDNCFESIAADGQARLNRSVAG